MIAIHKLCKAFDNKAVLRDFSCTMEDLSLIHIYFPSEEAGALRAFFPQNSFFAPCRCAA